MPAVGSRVYSRLKKFRHLTYFMGLGSVGFAVLYVINPTGWTFVLYGFMEGVFILVNLVVDGFLNIRMVTCALRNVAGMN